MTEINCHAIMGQRKHDAPLNAGALQWGKHNDDQ